MKGYLIDSQEKPVLFASEIELGRVSGYLGIGSGSAPTWVEI